MKVRSLLFGMLCMLALGASLVSCSDDDDDSLDDDGSKVTLPQTRVYILNEGSQGANNAGLAFYAPNKDADFISDIYKTQNNAKLGDLGQSMIEYEDEIYIAVYGSNYLTKLNAAGVELKRVSFVGDNDLSAGIRYIDAEDGYIYASFWGGAVAKGEFYQFNLSSCIRQQNSLTAQFVSFSLSNLANIFYPPQFLQ